MKADKSSMFPVPLDRISPDLPAPFPLYLFLHLNNRMVPLLLEGDSLGQAKLEELKQNRHAELWVPNSHGEQFRAYAQYLEKAARESDEAPRENISQKKKIFPPSSLDRAAQEALAKKDPTALSRRAAELLREQSTLKDSQERARSAENCRAFADTFLASAGDSLSEGVRVARSFQDAMAHSVFAGSIAAVMAAAANETNTEWLAQLIAAATFHDIGLAEIPDPILRKKTSELSIEERDIFEAHVAKAVRLLRDSVDPIPDGVIRMISEHHERADGSGFPEGKVDGELYLGSKFLILANEYIHLVDEEKSAAEAMKLLGEQCPAGKTLWGKIETTLANV